ncbi:hypothetical protein CPB85DRAFT_1342001 [Mucidula mucida]|nr:hypothetical protein CPB85DRAFT_1342001 [Mucidula mucida]
MGQIVKYRAMAGSMPLPQELIDRIIDQVQGEDDLRACAFVCRAWRNSSYRHLFSDLLFDSPTDTSGTADSPCHVFLGLLHTSPDLARHVRHVEVCDESRSSDRSGRWLLDSVDVFLETITRFKGLVSVEISFCAIRWEELRSISEALTVVFALPTLLRISINDIYDVPLDHLFALLRKSPVRELALSDLEIVEGTSDHERYTLSLEVLTLALNYDYHARAFSEWISDPESVVDLSITQKLCITIANSTEAAAASELLMNPILQRIDTLEVQAMNCCKLVCHPSSREINHAAYPVAHVDKRDNPLPTVFASFPRVTLAIFETYGCSGERPDLYFCPWGAVVDIVLWWTRSFERLRVQDPLEPLWPRIEDLSLTFSQRSAAEFHVVPIHMWHELDAALVLSLPELKSVSLRVDDGGRSAVEIENSLLLRMLLAFPSCARSGS